MKPFVRLLTALVFLALGQQAASAQQASFRAWNTGCGQNVCAATTRTPGGQVTMRFSRRGGADATWVLSFSGFETDLRPGSPIGIAIDYGPYQRFNAGAGYRLDRGRVVVSGLSQASPLFDALLKGSRATVEFQHREGFPIPLDFSLSGLTASLLWIDEQQGRSGAPEAVTTETTPPEQPQTSPETGEQKSAEQTPPAVPPQPGETGGENKPVPSGIPARVEKLHLADGDCRDYKAKHMVESREIDRLDANHVLYALPCYSGAYNVIYRIYVYDSRYPNDVKRESFAGYTDERGWYGRDQLINVSYDKESKTLRAFEKSRGLGDCGSTLELKWIKDSFWRLNQYRYWGKCDGSRLADKWPVVYEYKDPEEKP